MSDLPKTYDPKKAEEKWYKFWEEQGFFKADPHSKKKPYCIILPPPNVTGVLHMGHALVDTLQDVLIRWKRMLGYETLWVPGLDHAGISTQTVVERHLMMTMGKRRNDFEREEFLRHVWKWKEKSEKRILHQLKQLGSSCDWSRLRFTMDKEANRAVRTLFKKMYDEGLIYRDDYLVNWDPVTQTALADDEVEYEDRDSCLWYFRYPFEEGEGQVVVATTRPETMLGDMAVAVAPHDERFQHLIGKRVILPLINRPIPVIADHHVDPEFGSGVVKITPAHDPNDYEMGITHNLELINIMTPDGKINENGGEFEGLSREEAREAVIKRMKELGLIEKIEPYKHRVGVSYRSKAIIEPYLSKQWFVKMTAFKKPLLDAVKKGKVKLIPKNWESTYFHWIENLRDWCISRQLWWGHRIPIWYNKRDPEKTICYIGSDLPPEVKENPNEWEQDKDVLDTWFSSSLWPFSVLGWPEKGEIFKKFYPNSTLITGHDILFFWVARIIMMGEYAIGELPFPETFLHGLIYGKSYWRRESGGHIHYVEPKEKQKYDLGEPLPKDVESKWEKMSKSKGNVIDPIEIIESYGADAMRLALCASATQARQIDLDRRRFEEFRNFANKIWNGARFVFINLKELSAEAFAEGIDREFCTLEDRWILSLLNRTIKEVNHHLSCYEFDHATMRIYEFFWNEFCAYYVEMVKPVLFGKVGDPALKTNKQKILVVVLLSALRLMHPMAPFITEELFQELKKHFGSIKGGQHPYTQAAIEALHAPACILSPYPQVFCEEDINENIEKGFAYINEIIYAVRNIRAEMQIPPNLATDLIIIGTKDEDDWKMAEENKSIIPSLVRIEKILMEQDERLAEKTSKFHASAMVGSLKLIIPLPEAMKEKEKGRLHKEHEKLLTQLKSGKKRLANKDFIEKAPKKLVQETREFLKEIETKLQEINSKLKELS